MSPLQRFSSKAPKAPKKVKILSLLVGGLNHSQVESFPQVRVKINKLKTPPSKTCQKRRLSLKLLVGSHVWQGCCFTSS